jgi:uncharacterized membrane protein
MEFFAQILITIYFISIVTVGAFYMYNHKKLLTESKYINKRIILGAVLTMLMPGLNTKTALLIIMGKIKI